MRIRRHRRTRRQSKKQRKIIIISLVCFMFIMVGGYSAFQTNLNITAKGNIKEKSRVIQSWTSTSNEDFHTDYYRENIVTATFLDTANVPNNAIKSWNVSEDQTHGGVMAWIILNNKDNTKYDLFIGANNGVIANEDSSYLFYRFSGIEEINFNNNYDTSGATNMYGMFQNTINLTEIIGLENFVTNNVTNMGRMFNNTNLSIIDVSKFNTSNVKSMIGMFMAWDLISSSWGNRNLQKIVFGPNFVTSKVTDMSDMFSGTSLKELDLSNFDTSEVIDMFHMFNSCNELIELNLCSWDTRNVKYMNLIFSNTTKLTVIYVGLNWSTELASKNYRPVSSDGTTQIGNYNMFTGSGVSEVTTGQC